MSDGENETKDETEGESRTHASSFQEMGNSIFKASLRPIVEPLQLSQHQGDTSQQKQGRKKH